MLSPKHRCNWKNCLVLACLWAVLSQIDKIHRWHLHLACSSADEVMWFAYICILSCFFYGWKNLILLLHLVRLYPSSTPLRPETECYYSRVAGPPCHTGVVQTQWIKMKKRRQEILYSAVDQQNTKLAINGSIHFYADITLGCLHCFSPVWYQGYKSGIVFKGNFLAPHHFDFVNLVSVQAWFQCTHLFLHYSPTVLNWIEVWRTARLWVDELTLQPSLHCLCIVARSTILLEVAAVVQLHKEGQLLLKYLEVHSCIDGFISKQEPQTTSCMSWNAAPYHHRREFFTVMYH